MNQAEHQRRYLKTEKGKECSKRYKQSKKGKEAARRYRNSPGGIEARRRGRMSPRGRYCAHKSRAKARGIAWDFTFETWWAMWEPHFDKMGHSADSMHMCRYGDTGPYSPTNCRIDTARNNGREGLEKRRQRERGRE